MKQLLMLTLIAAMTFGCKDKATREDPMNESTQDETPMDTTSKSADRLEMGCYTYKTDNNDLKMEVTNIDGSNVKANLFYAYAEKDKNTGTFNGKLHGDKLIGEYTFMSEGIESVRDVAFKVEKNQLVEGFGDLEESGTRFKDTTNITYSTTTPWKKGDCN